ncbi:hypothetical protein Lser_V15G03259 [Lactuca serriola]
MDGSSSSPPSPSQPRPDSFYDQKDAVDEKPPSFSAISEGRPVSSSQDQHHLIGAPDLTESYKDVLVDNRSTYSTGPFAAIQESEKAPSVGELAEVRKHISDTMGESPYEKDKIPSKEDMRPMYGSSSNPGGYSYPTRPISYNSDHYGRH